MIADALRLSVYLGESVPTGPRLAADALMGHLARHGVAFAALHRGIEGFGLHRLLHTGRFPDVATDLPLVAVAVDGRDRIRDALAAVPAIVPRGLATLEPVRLATGADVSAATFPADAGGAAELTVCCAAGERAGSRPAYREVVSLLRRHGATGAIVLHGVDGVLDGRRRRARLFSRNAGTPTTIVSVGAPESLRAALPDLAGILRRPFVTLDGIALLKRDGIRLEPPPGPGGAMRGEDGWRAIGVHARRAARVEGRPLTGELSRRLREAGAAGVTTVLGDWGFWGNERPHGDRLGRLASHRPSWSVYVDRAEKVAEVWPLIDELTDEHGIVTSQPVPASRRWARDAVHGSLDLAPARRPPPGS
jgi:PII-like signaling protein